MAAGTRVNPLDSVQLRSPLVFLDGDDQLAADFSQRANAIVEGEKAALAVMPQIRERVAQLQAERSKAAAQAQQKAAEAQYQACLDNRSRLQKLAGLAKLDDSCPAPK